MGIFIVVGGHASLKRNRVQLDGGESIADCLQLSNKLLSIVPNRACVRCVRAAGTRPTPLVDKDRQRCRNGSRPAFARSLV
jgi:hypothetical protein